ncbi:hypothetical protein JHK84_052735 [Glycine max]|nr:hypothetical protein JHK84_052735 [Glycine max]
MNYFNFVLSFFSANVFVPNSDAHFQVDVGVSNRAEPDELVWPVLQKGWTRLEFETRKSFKPAPFSLQARRVGAGQPSFTASLHGGSSASASLSHKTLTLNLESSPFSFDFEPQHQPHIFDWTLSLTLSPSRPASAAVAPRQPHVFDCTSSLTISPLWLPSVVVAPRQPHPHGLPPWLRVILILPLTPNTCLRGCASLCHYLFHFPHYSIVKTTSSKGASNVVDVD